MMNRFEVLAGLLAGLKGAPASVLWALSLAGRPLSQGELLLLTGFSEKPVRRAVRLLLERGIIEREGPRVVALVKGWAEMPQDWGLGTGDRGSLAVESAENLVDLATVAEPAAAEVVGGPEITGEMTEKPRPAGAAGEITDAVKDKLTAGESSVAAGESAANGGSNTGGGRSGGFGGQNSRNDGRFRDLDVVVESDPDLDLANQQQQLAAAAKPLGRLLRRMGINGRALERLAGRADLAARPELVLGWWWYYRAQEGVRNPAGAAIARLDSHERPPEGFLALARLWPALPAGMRQELESLHLHNWSAEQIAAMLRPAYPDLTAAAVAAYMAITLTAGNELEGSLSG